MALECPNKEKAQRGHTTDHCAYGELALVKQVRLIASQLVRPELIGGLPKCFANAATVRTYPRAVLSE